VVRFSEPMATASITPQTVQLRPAGGSAVAPVNLQFRTDDRVVQLAYDALPPDDYEIVIDAAALTDRAGNPLGSADIVSRSSLRARSDGALPGRIYDTGHAPTALVAADFDGDGDLDLATADSASGIVNGSFTVSVLLNQGRGTFAPRTVWEVGNFSAA